MCGRSFTIVCSECWSVDTKDIVTFPCSILPQRIKSLVNEINLLERNFIIVIVYNIQEGLFNLIRLKFCLLSLFIYI